MIRARPAHSTTCLCLIAAYALALHPVGARAQLNDDDIVDAGASVADDSGAAGAHYTEPSPLRGLLATEPFDREPMKGVYFFPGDVGAFNENLYTAHPSLESDAHWNSDPSARRDVIERMVAAHINTVIMSYWGAEMPQWSPMALDASSVSAAIDAVEGKPLAIIPSLESGFDGNNPSGPHWRFSEDFPYANGGYAASALAPSLLTRLRTISALFKGRHGAWARMYDREGKPRYVVHILDAFAQRVPVVVGKTADQIVAEAFDEVARQISASEGIDIGFTLDVSGGDIGSYRFNPSGSGAALERALSVLAIQIFVSESRAGRVISGAPWEPPIDNNASNLGSMIEGKLQLLDLWRITGMPVIYDVTPGFDGRFVWAAGGNGFWGDNYNYTSDDWRNLECERKNEHFIGITFNTWNGYTEGYAAVPTVEHGATVYNWLTDLYAADPRSCDFVQYQDGRAIGHVSGTVCSKWRSLGGTRGMLGEPISDEQKTDRASVWHFADGSIFASSELGVYEVHGAIHQEYQRLGYDSSCLGLPISDEEASASGVSSRFEHGSITLATGATSAVASCAQPRLR